MKAQRWQGGRSSRDNAADFHGAKGIASGVTLPDVLVSLGIVGLLMTLLLPAVQQARRASGRLECALRLRQLAMATQSFESDHRRYPRQWCGSVAEKDRVFDYCLSPLTEVVGYLDEEVASSLVADDPAYDAPGAYVETGANGDAMRHGLDAFHCPADPHAVGPKSSYAFCRGNWPMFYDPGGPIPHYGQLRSADVIDGLSATALLSERLVGTGQLSSSSPSLRDTRLLPFSARFGQVDNAVAFAGNCVDRSLNQDAPRDPFAATTWVRGGFRHSAYHHLFPPNPTVTDCASTLGYSIYSARSLHEAGVNVAFCDGHVRFVADAISLQIWRAIGTRAGQEVQRGEQ
jgi:prepilin-type processing-associated H-X9-DG protein